MDEQKRSSDGKHPIQVAARRSGLTADVIRVWERRYGAVKPERTGTNRRLYSDDDVERLLLLAQVTRAGRRIGDVAGLQLEDLKELAEEDNLAVARIGAPAPNGHRSHQIRHHMDSCLDAINRLDAPALEASLSKASIDLSIPVLIEQFLSPLMVKIGDLWHDGTYRVAHEHLATSLIRSFMGTLRSITPPDPGAPAILVATPAGTRHEIGALMVAVLAANDGWKVTYLGPDLPAEDIAAAARSTEARAVALSIVYPVDDMQIGYELKRLAGQLDSDVSLFVGGASSNAYADVLEEANAIRTADITTMRAELQKLRT